MEYILAKFYKYEINMVWMLLPFISFIEAIFILFMETRLWKRIRKIVRGVFGPSGYTIYNAQQPKENNAITENNCPICLNNLDSNEFIMTPCKHLYHYYCLDEWMKQKAECPICKTQLPPIEDA